MPQCQPGLYPPPLSCIPQYILNCETGRFSLKDAHWGGSIRPFMTAYFYFAEKQLDVLYHDFSLIFARLNNELYAFSDG